MRIEPRTPGYVPPTDAQPSAAALRPTTGGAATPPDSPAPSTDRPRSQFEACDQTDPRHVFAGPAALREWVAKRLAGEFGQPLPPRIAAAVCARIRNDPGFQPRVRQSGDEST